MLRKTTFRHCMLLILLTHLISASYAPSPSSAQTSSQPAIYIANDAPYSDVGPPFPTALCQECEEEIWEEIPCDQLLTTTTTTTTLAPSITTSTTTTTTTTTTSTPLPLPPTAPPTITPPAVISTTTPATVVPTVVPIVYLATRTPSAEQKYNDCYCECKVGCKEFCRKVVASIDPKQQITQSSKTIQKLPTGHVEIKHMHQRKFVAAPYVAEPYVPPLTAPSTIAPVPIHAGQTNPIENSEECDKNQKTPQIKYNAGAPATDYSGGHELNHYTNALIDTPSYSLEDITKLLVSAARDFNNQPQLYYPQAHQATQPIYTPNYPTNPSQKQPQTNNRSQETPVPTHKQPQHPQSSYKSQDTTVPYHSQSQQPQTNFEPQDISVTSYGHQQHPQQPCNQDYAQPCNPQYPPLNNPQYAQQPSHAQYHQYPQHRISQYSVSESVNPVSYPLGAPLNIVPPQIPHHFAQLYSKVSDSSYANDASPKSAAAAAATISSDNAKSLSANYISKHESIIEADNLHSKYSPANSQYSASTLNEHPLFDFTLDSYLKDYAYPFQPQANEYSGYQPSHPTY